MDEQFPHDESALPQGDQEIKNLLRKIEQRLDFLENKIDTLIAQSASRPPQEKYFSKPFRPFRHDSHPRHRPEGEFEKRRDDDNRGFRHGKKKHFPFKRREHR